MPVTAAKSSKAASAQIRAKQQERTRKSELIVEGKQVPVSNLEKILYPKAGFTKGQVIQYYIRIAPVLLPHLKDRPLTLKRYPDGVEAGFFYEKRCPSHRPDWVRTASIWSKGNQEHINFCLANDLATLIWAANLADLELHTSLAHADSFECPTMIVFDLDPGPPANIIQCCQAALWMKQILDQLKLKSFPKTSGAKGLQVYVPLNTPTDYTITKPFARRLAEWLQQQHPELILSKMTKGLRKGKIFVDWSQNDAHKTTVCVYSLRAREKPTVSTPLEWSELEEGFKQGDPEKLTFLCEEALDRVEEKGDLFAPVLKLKQKVPTLA